MAKNQEKNHCNIMKNVFYYKGTPISVSTVVKEELENFKKIN